MFNEETIQDVIDEAVESAEEAIDEACDAEVEVEATDTDANTPKIYTPEEVSNLIDGAIVVGCGVGVAATAITAATVKVATPIVKKGFAKAKSWIGKKKKEKAIKKAAVEKAKAQIAADLEAEEEA